MKSNIETKMELMERRQAVHANKIQALMLMITVMQTSRKQQMELQALHLHSRDRNALHAQEQLFWQMYMMSL